MNALKAKEFYRRDVQYIVRDGKALIINEVILSWFLYVFNIMHSYLSEHIIDVSMQYDTDTPN